MSSSESEDDRMNKRVPAAGPVPKKRKTHVIRSSVQKKRVQCSKLMRNKWFIIGMSGLILLIILAIVLGVTLGKKSPADDQEIEIPLEWWQNATIYRIYVPSFVDSDRNGMGDFKGIQEKLSYLKELGVDVIWLSPIQNSNTVSGTDVMDYKEVDNEYGGLQDFRDLILAAQEMGLKVIMDIILNHSSSVHKWFKDSQSMTGSYNDYYIWSKSKSSVNGSPTPPNNWVSLYGGSAWMWDSYRNEFYLRQFWTNEPDLNYRNPQVVQEMTNVANFWSGMGVDGFYLRDISFLFEDNSLTNEPQLSNSQDYSSLSHNYTRDLAESYQMVVNIFAGATQPRFGQEKLLLIETNDRVMSDERWTQPYKMMTTTALYKLSPTFNGLELKTVVQQSLESFNRTKVWPVWTLGKEDRSRILSRFNQLAVGLQVISIFLPGSTSIYYGEEIQLTNHQSISFQQTIDPVAKSAGESNYTRVSRDPFHTPMKWNTSQNSGFSVAQTPWLPINNMDPTVDSQNKSSNSMFVTIKDLIGIKKSSVAIINGTIDYPIVDADIFSFTRLHPRNNTGFLIVWNVGNQRKTVSFYDTTYISNEMTVIRKIKPNGSQKETALVKKSDVSVDPKEVIVFSFWKQ